MADKRCLKSFFCRKNLCRTNPLHVSPRLLNRDLSNLIFIITGGHSGLGKTLSIQLLKQGATIIIGCRNPSDTRCTSLAQESYPGTIIFEQLDLSCFANVEDFVERITQRHLNENKYLHGIISNAGIMGVPTRILSTDGFESQFQTNYLSPFLLIELLTPYLLKTVAAVQDSTSIQNYIPRIINVSSSNAVQAGLTGPYGNVDLDDINFDRRTYNGFAGYGQSKLCQILHARALSKTKDGVLSVSLHPGSALSNITRNLFPYCVRVLISPIEKCTTGQISNWGAIQAQLHCVLSFGDDLDDGGFYSVEDSPLGNKGGFPMNESEIDNRQAVDDDLAGKLYRRSKLWVSRSGRSSGVGNGK